MLKLLISRCTRRSKTGAHSDHFLLHINIGHKAGRILEVDWAGPTMRLVDPAAGEVSKACLFVACLPLGRMSYVEPTLDMGQDTWLRRHVHAFACPGGSTPRVVPDSLRAGVESHPRGGEVVPDGAHGEMAAHHGSAVTPARVATPRDKPSAEGEVWQAALEIVAAPRSPTSASSGGPWRRGWGSAARAPSPSAGERADGSSRSGRGRCSARSPPSPTRSASGPAGARSNATATSPTGATTIP